MRQVATPAIVGPVPSDYSNCSRTFRTARVSSGSNGRSDKNH